MKKRLLMVLLVCVMSVFGVTACGGGDEDSSEKTETTKETTKEEKKEEVVEEEDAATDEDAYSELEAMIATAFMGVMDSGEGVYYAEDETGTFGILAFLDPESAESASFVGEITTQDNFLKIYDESSGTEITFEATENEDGTIQLDMGEEIGIGNVAECTVDEVIEALIAIDEYSTSVN